jgi:DNA-binding MarR family transcriptional regulator
MTSDLETHLGYWLRFVSNHVSHAFSLKVQAHGVTVAEWVVMRDLLDRPETAPSEVAGRIGMTRGAITKLVDRLAAKKLVERKPGRDDRRYQTLALTAAGRALVPKLAALADRNDREFFGHLRPAERRALEQTLQALVRHHGLKTIPTE